MYSLRFDMRAPAGSTPASELYRAALEMAEFADLNGGASIGICEHHGSEDGYLPSPLVMAAAVAARTERISITVTAVLAPLRNPVQLAEEMAVLDLISGGRVSYVFGLGYRAAEYELYGVPMRERGRLMDDALATVRAALRGDPLPGRDPALRVTPAPCTPGGPTITLGGSSEAAARRAARHGIGMIAERPGLGDAYRAACAENGIAPLLFVEGPSRAVTVGFVDRDPGATWEQLGPHLLHDARTYSAWNKAAGKTGMEAVTDAATVDELRAAGQPYRVFSPDEAVEHIRQTGMMLMNPLCGGAPPDIAWRSLRLLVDEVVPRLGG